MCAEVVVRSAAPGRKDGEQFSFIGPHIFDPLTAPHFGCRRKFDRGKRKNCTFRSQERIFIFAPWRYTITDRTMMAGFLASARRNNCRLTAILRSHGKKGLSRRRRMSTDGDENGKGSQNGAERRLFSPPLPSLILP